MTSLKHESRPILAYSFIIAIPILWGAFLSLPGVQAPIGNYWWDYLALKGLEVQIFDWEKPIESLWLPFLLPAALTKLASHLTGFGTDYLAAHCIICLITLSFCYKPIFLRLPTNVRFPTMVVLALFMIIPTDLSLTSAWSFKDINSIYYRGFYNRYLDIHFCLLSIFICTHSLEKPNQATTKISDLIFLVSILAIALTSKASYYLAFLMMLWGSFIITKSPTSGLGFAFGLCLAAVTYLAVPNYFLTLYEISQVRELNLSAFEILLVLILGITASISIYRLPRVTRLLFLIPVIALPSYCLSIGNYGDYFAVRICTAAILLAFILMNMGVIPTIQLKLTHKAFERETTISWKQLNFILPILAALPIIALVKATVTIPALVIGNHFNIGGNYINYEHIPGFFSHPLILNEKAREAYNQTGELPPLDKTTKRKFTASFFTLYARDLDEFSGQFTSLNDNQTKIAWISFAGMTPDLLGFGTSPDSARPWYLFKHEISRKIHPDFNKIDNDTDLTIIDNCGHPKNLSALLDVFGSDIMNKQTLLWKTHCFSAYGNPPPS